MSTGRLPTASCTSRPWAHVSIIRAVTNDGVVHHRLTEFARHGWGEGGEEFAWWCTEESAAFLGTDPVYRSQEPELRKMCGDALYEMIAEYLDARRAAGFAPVSHPSEIPVILGPTRTQRSA